MTPDQTTLALYTCRTCGKELEYQGVGRPPAYCADHRPASFPPLKGVRSAHQLNGGLSRASQARAGDPETSHAAAASITPGAIEARILEAFDQFGWLTPFECVTVLDASDREDTVRSAVSRLRKAGVLMDTGTRRPSPRGRASMVLRKATSP